MLAEKKSVKYAERSNILPDALFLCLFFSYFNKKVIELAIMVIPFRYSSVFPTNKLGSSLT